MRRVAGLLTPLGSAALVGLLAWIHAAHLAVPAYPVLGTARTPWTVLLALTVAVAGYATGLPDGPATRRRALACSAAAVAGSLAVVSALQLVVGQPLLPRFVALGMVLVVPEADARRAIERLEAAGERAMPIGRIEPRAPGADAVLIG